MRTILGGAALGAIKRVDIASHLGRARPLLGAFDRIDIDGITDQIAPLITPEPVKGIVTAPGNAESLLISAFISQKTELRGHATPVNYPLVQSTHYPMPHKDLLEIMASHGFDKDSPSRVA